MTVHILQLSVVSVNPTSSDQYVVTPDFVVVMPGADMPTHIYSQTSPGFVCLAYMIPCLGRVYKICCVLFCPHFLVLEAIRIMFLDCIKLLEVIVICFFYIFL